MNPDVTFVNANVPSLYCVMGSHDVHLSRGIEGKRERCLLLERSLFA